MAKYYRVKKQTFMWDEGAIISDESSAGRYVSTSDVWDRIPGMSEYISANIIEHENNSDFFEQVWPMGKLEKAVFGSRKQAQAAAAAVYKGDKK